MMYNHVIYFSDILEGNFNATYNFKEFLANYNITAINDYTDTIINNDNVNLFFQTLTMRYYDTPCTISTYEDVENAKIKWVRKLYLFVINSYNYYNKLLNCYKTLENELLNGLKSNSSGTSRFNDTPQSTGLFEDDAYTTNITQTKAESEVNTKNNLDKLQDVQNKYNNVLTLWLDESRMLFLEQYNLRG